LTAKKIIIDLLIEKYDFILTEISKNSNIIRIQILPSAYFKDDAYNKFHTYLYYNSYYLATEFNVDYNPALRNYILNIKIDNDSITLTLQKINL
jgi:hypothetical protein